MDKQTGTFNSTLDEKGRIGIPLCLRDSYEGKLVILHGLPPSTCAWVMTEQGWEKMMQRFEDAADANSLAWPIYHTFRQILIGTKQDIEIDKIGRISIPAAIRVNMGLIRDCLILSDEDHLEIWDSGTFYRYVKEQQELILSTMQNLGPLRLFGPKKKEGENGDCPHSGFTGRDNAVSLPAQA